MKVNQPLVRLQQDRKGITWRSFVFPYKKWIIASAVSSLVIGACEVGAISIIQQLIDQTLSGSGGRVGETVVLALVVLLAGLAGKYLAPYSSGRLGALIIRDGRASLVAHLDQIQTTSRDRMHTGDTLSRVNHDISAAERFLGQLPDYVYKPVIVLVIMVYLAFVHWQLLLVSVLPIPIALYLANRAGKPLGVLWEQYHGLLSKGNSIMQEALSRIGIIKSYGLEERFHDRCEDVQEQALAAYNRINKRDIFTMMPLMFMMYELPYVLCMIYGGYLAIHDELAPSGLAAFLLLLYNLVGPATELPRLLMEARSISGVWKRLHELFELPLERKNGSDSAPIGEHAAVEFQQVDFSYHEGRKALNRLNFRINQGEKIALVGPSGGGKSTILQLICGFYPPDKGTVRLLGQDVEDWSLTALRERIAVVEQEPYLFTGTIGENIRFGNPNASEQDIVMASEQACAHDFIRHLPGGYHTPVGEGGLNLSGGQRQRIAIARAVLKGSPILLMDEPTSSLDVESERLLHESLERLPRDTTVLIAAHRLSTIEQCDRILVMDGGTVVESGTHEELLQQGGLYQQWMNKQHARQEPGQANLVGGETIHG